MRLILSPRRLLSALTLLSLSLLTFVGCGEGTTSGNNTACASGESCQQDCAYDSAMCNMACASGSTCSATCQAGQVCSFTCEGSASCDFNCEQGSCNISGPSAQCSVMGSFTGTCGDGETGMTEGGATGEADYAACVAACGDDVTCLTGCAI